MRLPPGDFLEVEFEGLLSKKYKRLREKILEEARSCSCGGLDPTCGCHQRKVIRLYLARAGVPLSEANEKVAEIPGELLNLGAATLFSKKRVSPILISLVKNRIFEGKTAFYINFYELHNLLSRSRLEEGLRAELDWLFGLDSLAIDEIPFFLGLELQETISLKGYLISRLGNFETVISVLGATTEEQARSFPLTIGKILLEQGDGWRLA